MNGRDTEPSAIAEEPHRIYSGEDVSGAIVAELMRERFDVWLNRRIQNQKISNIKKVSGEA